MRSTPRRSRQPPLKYRGDKEEATPSTRGRGRSDESTNSRKGMDASSPTSEARLSPRRARRPPQKFSPSVDENEAQQQIERMDMKRKSRTRPKQVEKAKALSREPASTPTRLSPKRTRRPPRKYLPEPSPKDESRRNSEMESQATPPTHGGNGGKRKGTRAAAPVEPPVKKKKPASSTKKARKHHQDSTLSTKPIKKRVDIKPMSKEDTSRPKRDADETATKENTNNTRTNSTVNAERNDSTLQHVSTTTANALQESTLPTGIVTANESTNNSSMAPPVMALVTPDQQQLQHRTLPSLQNICTRLQHNDPFLVRLDLSRQRLETLEMKRLGQGLSNSCVVKKLVLSDCYIGNHGVKTLVDTAMLSTTTKASGLITCLESLWLDGNGIGPAGANTLASWLGTSTDSPPKLKRLFLAFNDMGAVGAEALASSFATAAKNTPSTLSWWFNVEMLDIGENNIGNEGASAFGSAVTSSCGKKSALSSRSPSELSEIRLYGNGIGDVGVETLAKGLLNAYSLKELDLRYNNITNKGARALGKALRRTNTLQSLLMVGNRIDKDGASALTVKEGIQVVFFPGDVVP